MSKEIRKLWFRNNAIATVEDIRVHLATLQRLMAGTVTPGHGAAPAALKARIKRLQGQVEKALVAVKEVPITEAEKAKAEHEKHNKRRSQ